MAEMAVLGVYFKHPYTGVNGVRKRDWSIRNPSSPIAVSSLFSAPVKSGLMTPDMSRHPRFTESFLRPD